MSKIAKGSHPAPKKSKDMTLSALEKRIKALEGGLSKMKEGNLEDRISLVVFSGDMDRLLSAFIIATSAAALGMTVSMFFTFWGVSALKKKTHYTGKPPIETLISLMLPSSAREVPLSKLNFAGMGPKLLKQVMKRKNVLSLEEFRELAASLGVRRIVCGMSKDLLGITDAELIGPLEGAGATTFLEEASRSKITLFI